MSNVEQIEQSMTEIGELVDTIAVVEQHGADQWVIGFDDEIAMHIVYDELARKLTMAVEIGAPNEAIRAQLNDLLLSYNYLWADTGGVRMALDGPGGNVVQLFDLFLLDLDLTTLADVVTNLSNKARHWREIIAQDELSDEDIAAEGADPLGNAMRV